MTLGLRKPFKAVPTSGLLQKAKDYLKQQQSERTFSDAQEQLEEFDNMSASSMLPPAPLQQQAQHLTNGSSSNGRAKSDVHGVNDSSDPANLNDDSMMVLSQSVDSLHTVGTASGSEALDVSSSLSAQSILNLFYLLYFLYLFLGT